jgi:hypothetical protein
MAMFLNPTSTAAHFIYPLSNSSSPFVTRTHGVVPNSDNKLCKPLINFIIENDHLVRERVLVDLYIHS